MPGYNCPACHGSISEGRAALVSVQEHDSGRELRKVWLHYNGDDLDSCMGRYMVATGNDLFTREVIPFSEFEQRVLKAQPKDNS